jgi:hypothetical protein
VAVVEIEVDPAVVAAFAVDQDVIAPDVAVFLPLAVEVPDGCLPG